MLDFRERMKATRRLAEPRHIDLYRSILSARGSRAASSVKTDRRVLAEELVYEILGYMTEEELAAAQNGVRTISTAAASAVSGSPAPVKKKINKYEEYPNIRWKDLDNPLIRTADSIFSDRVNLWQNLRAVEDGLYEAAVPADTLAEFLRGSIRMELCFTELRNFDRNGAFLGKHPFIAQRTQRERLLDLLRTDPIAFTEEMHRIRLNISRYQSHLNSAKFPAEKKKQEQANLEKFKTALSLCEEVLKSVING